MTVFEQEVREKRRIAAGDRHRKRRGRGCTLPSDCLTPTQLRRLSGQVRTYRLDVPLRLDQVEALPEDLRREYLTRLRDGCGVNAQMLATMLGTTEVRAAELMAKSGVPQGTPDGAALARWERFCGKGAEHEGVR